MPLNPSLRRPLRDKSSADLNELPRWSFRNVSALHVCCVWPRCVEPQQVVNPTFLPYGTVPMEVSIAF